MFVVGRATAKEHCGDARGARESYRAMAPLAIAGAVTRIVRRHKTDPKLADAGWRV
jgi:hypothetical protein